MGRVFNLYLVGVSVIFFVCVCTIVDSQVGTKIMNQEFKREIICIEHEVCGACMSATIGCRWCADPYFSKTQPRCNTYERLLMSGCSQSLIQRYEPDLYELIENHPLQDMNLGVGETVVQIQPQRVRLSLKPGQSKTIKFTYRPARNYPLDLYYLMDLSWSMKDDKETLVSLRDDLPFLLKNLTKNFRLGFGSFADKPVMPYISVDERRRSNPCSAVEEICESTYGFRHRLSLTNKVDQFIDKVNRSAVTANLDNAEAQLDALMQVLVCGDRIGWLEESRKIVILLTDGLLHTAGDGILGGANKRNDEKCHLDDNGYYSESEIYDYPSIAQIYKLLEYYKVNVIFAITEDLMQYYNSLHKVLDKFTYVAKLENDSSNILKLVKKGYEEIVSAVNFKDNLEDGPLKIKYFTDCGIAGGHMNEVNTCKGVEFGKPINFEVHLRLEKCTEFAKMRQTINIIESQLGQDSLTLNVDLQCGCECDNNMAALQAACFTNSHLVCGVCECNKGWSGPNCNCSVGDEEASAQLMDQCRDSRLRSSRPCSGRGDCDCGKCNCDRGFIGKYCQCTPCEVNSENDLECGGINQGQCVCGECLCKSGWTGDACQCSSANQQCIAPGSGVICSGHGDCRCGKCECSLESNGEQQYGGAYCEMCTNCKNSLCVEAEASLICYADKNCDDVSGINVYNNYTFYFTENLNDKDNTSEPRCVARQYLTTEWCEYQYTYSVVKDYKVNVTLHSRECYQTNVATSINIGIMIVVATVIFGLVAIAAYKIWQVKADRRAYEKFEKETALSLLSGTQTRNPLYISPISQFKMPEGYPRDKND